MSSKIYIYLSLLLIPVAQLQAETVNCTAITSLPYTITGSGNYCLRKNFDYAGKTVPAITILGTNVTLDFNRYKIESTLADPNNKPVGIYAYNRWNVTIKNGTLKGFKIAIHIDAKNVDSLTSDNVIKNMLIIDSYMFGIKMRSKFGHIANNRILRTYGYLPDGAKQETATAIWVHGAESRVTGNHISEVTSKGSSTGLYAVGTAGIEISDNRISSISSPAYPDNTRGINLSTSENAQIARNMLTKTGKYGIDGSSSDNSLVRDNSIANVSDKAIHIVGNGHTFIHNISADTGNSQLCCNATLVGANN